MCKGLSFFSSTYSIISKTQLFARLSTMGAPSWVIKCLRNYFSSTPLVVCANNKNRKLSRCLPGFCCFHFSDRLAECSLGDPHAIIICIHHHKKLLRQLYSEIHQPMAILAYSDRARTSTPINTMQKCWRYRTKMKECVEYKAEQSKMCL